MDTETDVRGRPRKRAAILRAAIEVFEREGYDGASVDVIAIEAGVVKRTIYNHFGDKQSLFLTSFKDAFDRTNAHTLATLDAFSDRPTDLTEELVDFGKRLAECLFGAEATALRRLADTEAVRHQELVAAARQDGPGRVVALLARRFAGWSDEGLIRTPDPKRAAYHFMALATHEVQTRMMTGEPISDSDFSRAVEDGVRAFLRAYAGGRSATV